MSVRIVRTWENEPAAACREADKPPDHEGRIREHERRVDALLHEEFEAAAQGKRRCGTGRHPVTVRHRVECWCVETKEYFPSFAAAGRSIGKDANAIRQAVVHGIGAGGFHWTEKKPE